MRLKLGTLTLAGAGVALLLAITPGSHASTIIKLNLGGVSPDISMDAGGTLGTVSDGNAATTGDQDTAIEYTSFLEPIQDIQTATASFSMAGLQANGLAQINAGLVTQYYSGGTINLYDPNNGLLLSGTLNTSVLTGVMGPPGTGGLFTTSLGTITGGALQPYILPNTLSLTMNLTDVNGGAGLSVGLAAPVLSPFTADAFVTISGDPDPTGNIPEPASVALVMSAAAGLFAARRRN